MARISLTFLAVRPVFFPVLHWLFDWNADVNRFHFRFGNDMCMMFNRNVNANSVTKEIWFKIGNYVKTWNASFSCATYFWCKIPGRGEPRMQATRSRTKANETICNVMLIELLVKSRIVHFFCKTPNRILHIFPSFD